MLCTFFYRWAEYRGASTVGPSTVGSITVGPSAVGPSAVGPSTVGLSTVGPNLLGQAPQGQEEVLRKRKVGGLVSLVEGVGCVLSHVSICLLFHNSRRVSGAVVAVFGFAGINNQTIWWAVIGLLREVGGPGDLGPS